ncbi:phosphatidylglycerol lysyltransferase domain-containing protein [Rhizobium sp. FY34]|uniref:phosphatidylglycerol lysyltransferase domain-containing protein n=1 Tax=Rhizobium sp. FY34 TaxID=2562309 RepID=UPI001FF06DC4|nr:phosphatidylglycerol lysyltransferase domain-containing protein [Rhizobium sp. FY34]
MDYVSADRDMSAPTLPSVLPAGASRTPFAFLSRSTRAVRGALGFTGLVSVTVVLFLYLFLEETLLALRIWALPSINGETGTTLSLTLIAGAFAGRRMIRPLRRARAVPLREDLERAVTLLEAQPNASAGLVRLGDKKVLFSDAGDAFIMYAQKGRSFVALFDPVGPRAAWPALLVKFMAEARASGCRPVFYQVSPDFLPFAVEAGLNPYKLGEQAVVDLTTFDLKGGAWLKLRRSINRAERDGLQFSLLSPQEVPAVLGELRLVSDAWLGAHNAAEKGFSLGTFQNAYVCASPVAVIRMEGRIVAFANILTSASQGDAFIDLMRHLPGTHRGMMDLLFVKIMERLKADGFRSLNLGMAPLSGLATHRRAPIWNHIGARIFERGERYYNFKGVLAFKSKFDPQWQPRYLVAGGVGLPVVSLYDVTMLIGGGVKGILRR